MAYYESITAGRGAVDSFNNSLANQRMANVMLNESMANFANTISNAGALYDNAKIRQDALKYQRMRDFYNDKQREKAFNLQEKQANLNMEFAKKHQAFNELRNKEVLRNDKLRNANLALTNQNMADESKWLKENKYTPPTKIEPTEIKQPVASVANQTPTNTENAPTTIEEIKKFVNPMFRS
ncbi:hypothetical protein [Helicobacter cetorum]|uniref:hypothetical protein n=1 Tax=Helicobacter cetorum TaxID=138563 RepID=UPI000CF19F07|nr:hypothetical protein [Helicobacter cetorum]